MTMMVKEIWWKHLGWWWQCCQRCLWWWRQHSDGNDSDDNNGNDDGDDNDGDDKRIPGQTMAGWLTAASKMWWEGQGSIPLI